MPYKRKSPSKVKAAKARALARLEQLNENPTQAMLDNRASYAVRAKERSRLKIWEGTRPAYESSSDLDTWPGSLQGSTWTLTVYGRFQGTREDGTRYDSIATKLWCSQAQQKANFWLLVDAVTLAIVDRQDGGKLLAAVPTDANAAVLVRNVQGLVQRYVASGSHESLPAKPIKVSKPESFEDLL